MDNKKHLKFWTNFSFTLGHWGLGVLVDRSYIIDPFSITLILGPCRLRFNFEYRYNAFTDSIKYQERFKDLV